MGGVKKLQWVWWKNVAKAKQSKAKKFMKRKMKLFAKLKKAWNKCLAKSNNNQILCKIKIKVKKAKYWKNHHKKFWKENLMRWNAMKEFKLAMAKFMNAKNLVEK